MSSPPKSLKDEILMLETIKDKLCQLEHKAVAHDVQLVIDRLHAK